MILRMLLSALAGIGGLGLVFSTALAAEPIKIGEINSYKRLPAFLEPYKKGWTLAVEQINATGGVLGRPLQVVSRDDTGKPGEAVKIAAELLSSERVVLIAGGFFSHIGLALADFAQSNKTLYLAAEPLSDALVWSKGNRYTFRLRPSTYMQAHMLASAAAELPVKRWATIAPNYKYGQDAVAAFLEVLRAKRPDIEVVVQQWPPLFKIDAGAEVQALAAATPEAIYNVTFGADLSKFVREGTVRGLFEDRAVVSLLTGEPEYLDALKDEAPEGWIVTGYPWYDIETEAHKRFREAYQARWSDYPRAGSVVGYATFQTIAAALENAGSTETEALITAMKGLKVDTPFGEITFREIDHQSTMGAFVGKTSLRDGRGVMVDWVYADGADHLPDDAAVEAMRPSE